MSVLLGDHLLVSILSLMEYQTMEIHKKQKLPSSHYQQEFIIVQWVSFTGV